MIIAVIHDAPGGVKGNHPETISISQQAIFLASRHLQTPCLKGQEHKHQDHQHSQDDEPQLNFILRHLMILYIISVPNATNLGHYIWRVLTHNILNVVFDLCIKRYGSLSVVRLFDT